MARGGKREGAGRKKGALTRRTRVVAERALAEGKTPLEIMLENMLHFQKVAIDAEAIIDGLTAEEVDGGKRTPEEQFKFLLAKAKHAAGLRVMAHECARDAARYMHPALASVTHSGDAANPLTVVERIERIVRTEAAGQDAADHNAEGVPTAH